MSNVHGCMLQDQTRTVVDAESSKLDIVDETDERDVVGGVDAVVQLSIIGDRVAGIVEFGVVDIRRVGDVDQVCLPVERCIVSYGFHANVTAVWPYLYEDLLSSPPWPSPSRARTRKMFSLTRCSSLEASVLP